jgi:hypothetical protein
LRLRASGDGFDEESSVATVGGRERAFVPWLEASNIVRGRGMPRADGVDRGCCRCLLLEIGDDGTTLTAAGQRKPEK